MLLPCQKSNRVAGGVGLIDAMKKRTAQKIAEGTVNCKPCAFLVSDERNEKGKIDQKCKKKCLSCRIP